MSYMTFHQMPNIKFIRMFTCKKIAPIVERQIKGLSEKKDHLTMHQSLVNNFLRSACHLESWNLTSPPLPSEQKSFHSFYKLKEITAKGLERVAEEQLLFP